MCAAFSGPLRTLSLAQFGAGVVKEVMTLPGVTTIDESVVLRMSGGSEGCVDMASLLYPSYGGANASL